MDYALDKYKLDLRSNVKARLRVEKQCERTKKMLTANSECPFNLECIMNDVDVKGSLTRDEFEKLSAPLLEQMLIPVREGTTTFTFHLSSMYAPPCPFSR